MSVGHYESTAIADRLTTILASLFPEDAVLSVAELAGFDQFHTGGLAATMRLADMLALHAGSRVLDVGSGLGGPARYIAATFGAHVTGIDASRSFIEAANMLSARSGLADRVAFRYGDALALGLAPGSFDAAVMQHVAMNVADRAALYAGIHDVLAPGGAFLTYDAIERTGPPTFPVPWSPVAETSFLLTEDATRAALEAAGFAIETWRVEGPEAAAGFAPSPGAQAPPLATILGVPDFGRAVANFSASLADGRVGILTALARKRPS